MFSDVTRTKFKLFEWIYYVLPQNDKGGSFINFLPKTPKIKFINFGSGVSQPLSTDDSPATNVSVGTENGE